MFQIKKQMDILTNRERYPLIPLSHRYFIQVLTSDLNQSESDMEVHSCIYAKDYERSNSVVQPIHTIHLKYCNRTF